MVRPSPDHQTFTFGLPPMVGSLDTWEIDGPIVRKNGKVWIDLRQVESGAFSVRGGSQRLRFSLNTPQSQKRIIAYPGRPADRAASWLGCHELIVAVLDRLEQVRPDVRVSMMGGTLGRWFAFLSALGALFFQAVWLAVVVFSQDPTGLTLVARTLVALFSVLIAWFSRPWGAAVRRSRTSPGEAATMISEGPPLSRRREPRHR
jgi:hypothetical protein